MTRTEKVDFLANAMLTMPHAEMVRIVLNRVLAAGANPAAVYDILDESFEAYDIALRYRRAAGRIADAVLDRAVDAVLAKAFTKGQDN